MNKIFIILLLLTTNVFASEIPTIQQHIETYNTSECVEFLEYFQNARDANPDEKYFEFMLEKWESRCI